MGLSDAELQDAPGCGVILHSGELDELRVQTVEAILFEGARCMPCTLHSGTRGLTLLCWLLFAAPATALDLVETRWGFDGKIVPQRFNIVSVLVDNPSPEAFDGRLVLQKQLNMGMKVDAPLVETVFIGPFARRWVQFYPFIANDWDEFRLSVLSPRGRTLDSFDLSKGQSDWFARAYLQDARSLTRSRFAWPGLPEELFPPFATATDTLQALVISHMPNWDEPRRKAFRGWLERGGIVFVAQDASNEFPKFSGDLAFLSTPLEVSNWGAGQIRRLEKPLEAIDISSDLESHLPRQVRRGPDGGMTLEGETEKSQETGGPVQTSNFQPLISSETFLAPLKRMTRPEHNWPLLHFLFWVYLLIVFPGCWIIGLRWSDYRAVYGTLLVTVACFSLLFGYVGQRGYGESTTVNSVAIIRSAGEGSADVSLWSNVFVTSGGDYEIRHRGRGTLYSTCNSTEAVRGQIQNGAEASFLVDIPPFSGRDFAVRLQADLLLPKGKIVSIQREQGRLTGLQATFDPPPPPDVANLLWFHEGQFHQALRQGQEITLGPVENGRINFTTLSNLQSGYAPWNYGQHDAAQLYRELFEPLAASSLGLIYAAQQPELRLPAGMIRLYYYASLPKELAIENRYLGRQAGWALFAIDLPLPADETE